MKTAVLSIFLVTLWCCLGGLARGYVVKEMEIVAIQEWSVSRWTCADVELVTRAEWGARPPKHVTRMGTPVTIAFIHHTDMPECYTLAACEQMAREIQKYHMDVRGWDDIGYNFLVGQDGRVYEGRGWDRVGAHTLGWNAVAVAFSVMGNYTDHVPDVAAIDAIHNMIQCGIDNGKLTNDYYLYGHRDVEATLCPGTSFYNLIKTWPHFGPLPPVKPTPTPGVDKEM